MTLNLSLIMKSHTRTRIHTHTHFVDESRLFSALRKNVEIKPRYRQCNFQNLICLARMPVSLARSTVIIQWYLWNV